MKTVVEAAVGLDVENIGLLIEEEIKSGTDPLEILDALSHSMDIVGDKFESGEYFLYDLIMAGETMKEALRSVDPHLKGEKVKGKGKVVIGTIEGDLHDIGKNIVKSLLRASGVTVLDLGMDVPPRMFVEVAKREKARVIGVSALLSISVPRLAEVARAVEDEGLRGKVKVIAGGAAVRPYHTKRYGVDAAVNSAVVGVRTIKAWLQECRQC